MRLRLKNCSAKQLIFAQPHTKTVMGLFKWTIFLTSCHPHLTKNTFSKNPAVTYLASIRRGSQKRLICSSPEETGCLGEHFKKKFHSLASRRNSDELVLPTPCKNAKGQQYGETRIPPLLSLSPFYCVSLSLSLSLAFLSSSTLLPCHHSSAPIWGTILWTVCPRLRRDTSLHHEWLAAVGTGT